jgi:hypothetical protein
VLLAQGDDELLVGLLLAVLVEHTHVRGTAVESLGSLAETAGKTVVDESQLQDTLEGVENGHLALGGVAGNLDLILDLGGVVFYVRLYPSMLAFHSHAHSSQSRSVTRGRRRIRESGLRQLRQTYHFEMFYLPDRSSKLGFVRKESEGGEWWCVVAWDWESK